MGRGSIGDVPELRGKTFVVTGGNSGIGLETVRGLAARGAHVVLACRDVAKGSAAVETLGTSPDEVAISELDLADLASVRACAARLRHELPHLDGLINNAGVMMTPLARTVDGFELQFGTNVLGHFVLVGEVLPLLDAAPAGRWSASAAWCNCAGVFRWITSTRRSDTLHLAPMHRASWRHLCSHRY